MDEDQARRWSRDDKKFVYIPQPSAVANYKKHMDESDRMKQNVNKYRVSMHQKHFGTYL